MNPPLKTLKEILYKIFIHKKPIDYEFYTHFCELDLVYSYQKVDVFPLFNVDIEKCRNPFGFSYGGDASHYFVRQLLDLGNENAEYEESYLFKFYDRWRPNTIGEVFGLNCKTNSRYLKQELIEGFMLPWQNSNSISNTDAGWQYCGPVSRSMGLAHFNRLKNVKDSIVKFGYRPEFNKNKNDIHLKGYFLKKDFEFRFLITNGTHRMAVLSYLYSKKYYSSLIPVTFRVNNMRMIDVAHLSEWPQVRNGNISKADARYIFDVIFEGRDIIF